MKLSVGQKKKLVASAKLVYVSYLALDLLQHHDLTVRVAATPNTEMDKKPLAQHIIEQINTSQSQHFNGEFSCANQFYALKIARLRSDCYSVVLSPNTATEVFCKLPADYTDADIVTLCSNKNFTFSQEGQGVWSVSLAMTPQHTIGGAGKIALYRTHLVTLFNIIQKIASEEDITNLLVALATGSGKTFVQALWFCVLSLADFTGIFSLPDQLIPQFLKDIARLLPDTMMQTIAILRDDSCLEDSRELLNYIMQSSAHLITSSNHLLNHCYSYLNILVADRSFLIFDEQHLLMENERRRLRLLILAKNFLAMFLTATPDKNTYQNSGSKPVAIMSSGQKQKSGQGQFPHICPIQAQSIAEMHQQNKVAFWSFACLQQYVEKLLLIFYDAIQPEHHAVIHALFDELPYLTECKADEVALRWRLQSPIAKKMLCIIEDNETLVNCCDYLQKSSQRDVFNNYKHSVYHNGNFVDRKEVSDFFGIPDIDHSTLQAYWVHKQHEYLQSFTPAEQAIIKPLLNRSLHDQVKLNMFHYLIEYILSDVSNLSMIEHNAARKRSPQDFMQGIKSHYRRRNTEYFYAKLSQEIDSEGADLISNLLSQCSAALGNVIAENQQNILLRWTDNWFLDDVFKKESDFFDHFNTNDKFHCIFDDYVERNKLIGVLSGMDEEETPIQDSIPFSGLYENRYSLHGNGSQKAKKRQRTSLELLNHIACESSFTPNYLNITEQQADNYFRLGFMGIYVSNKKTEGFSDPNLHTILNPVQNSHDANNRPKKQIQAIGRNRGLDDTQFGHYIPGFGRNFSSDFDLKFLLKEDYYPELFAAEETFNQKYIAVLGDLVGKKIITWYHKYQNEDESVDPEQLKQQLFYLIADALRQLNSQNSHQIHLSRRQLPQVIAYAMKKLEKESEHNHCPYQLSLFVRMFASVLNAICACYFFIISIGVWLKIKQHESYLNSESAQTDDTTRADHIYLKIIQQTHFKDLVAQNLAAGELKVWLLRKVTIAQKLIENNTRAYLLPAISTQLESALAEGIFPLLAKMLSPEKQAALIAAVRTYPEFLSLLQKNGDLLQQLQDTSSDQAFATILLSFLHQIPGLETLQAADVVNYPARVNAHQQWFQAVSPLVLQNEPELKQKVIDAFSLFLTQPEFASQLEGCVLVEDQPKIAAALQQDRERVRVFVSELLEECMLQPDISQQETTSVAGFFSRLVTHFGLTDVKFLPDRVEDLRTTMTDYQMYCIATQIRCEVLPCLVNFYPLAQRKALLESVSIEALQSLLATRKEALLDLIQQNNPKEIAGFLFATATIEVPSPIDIDQAKDEATLFIQQQTQGFSSASNAIATLVDSMATHIGLETKLLDSNVDALLQSNDCLKHLSLLLPFHHWEQLCQLFNEHPTQRKELATALISLITNDTLTPAALLQAINRAFDTDFLNTEDYVAQQIQTIDSLAQGQHTFCTTQAQKIKIAGLMRAQGIPLLAAYIEPQSKQRILEHVATLSDEALCQIYPSVFAAIARLDTADNPQNIVCELLQALVPNLIQYQQLVDPRQHAEQSLSKLQHKLMQKFNMVFLMNPLCQEKLGDLCNSRDAQALKHCLSDRQHAETLSALNLNPDATMDAILTSMREAVPELANVRLLSERLQTFTEDIQKYAKQGFAALDPLKISDTLLEQVQPIFEHRHFRRFLQLYLGSLTQEEVQFICIAQGHSEQEAQAIATRMLRFKELVMQENFTAFKAEFLTCEAGRDVSWENYRLTLVLDDLAQFADEIMDIHCYYRQHDAKGQQNSDASCALSSKLSATAKDIRIPTDNSFMSGFSRQIFFIQGMRLGLPLASQVYADAHQKTLRVLEYIHHHLLRPLWWSVNNWSFMIHGIACVKAAYIGLQSWVNYYLHALNQWIQQCFARPTTAYESPYTLAAQFDNSAFTIAKTMNDLRPLTPEQVSNPVCPEDVIKHVEDNIRALPHSNLGLFAPPRAIPCVVSSQIALFAI